MIDKKIEIDDLTKQGIHEINQEPQNNDLISLLAIQELLNIRKIKTISRIKPEQVPTIAKLLLYSKTFHIPFVSRLANHILELQISINGLGRKELVQLVQKRNEMIETQKITSKDIFR